MLDTEKFMHKPFFEREPLCDHPVHHHEHMHHEKPRYTMTEEVEHATRLMRETIDRLLRFEKRLKDEITDLSKTLMSDNVIFKNTMHESWNTFLMEVKNEVNIFESTTTAELNAFKAELESNYATLSEDVRKQIVDSLEEYEAKLADTIKTINERIEQNNNAHAEAFAEFQRNITTQLNTFEQTINAQMNTFIESVNTTLHSFKDAWESIIEQRLNSQDAKLADAEMYMKTNLTATVTTLIGDMHANGEFTDIIEGEVFNDLQRKADGLGHISAQYFGAVGDGETDNTNALKLAVAHSGATGRVVWIPDGVYMVDGDIPVPSNATIKGSRNAVIKRKTTDEDSYAIFKLENVHDVRIEGITIQGDKSTHSASTGEWGMGVSILSSNNITLSSVKLAECWGDGVYIGTADGKTAPSKAVEILNCYVDRNRRNGISVINCDGLNITSCAIKGTGGTAPEDGICFECNESYESVRNALVSNCQFEGNSKYGIGFTGGSNVYEVVVTGCIFADDYGVYVTRTMVENQGGFININGCTFVGKNGVQFDAKSVNGIPVTINNCHFNNDAVCVRIGYPEMDVATIVGGIVMQGCVFEKWGSTYYPVMINVGVNANASYDNIYIDGTAVQTTHNGVFVNAPVVGKMYIAPRLTTKKTVSANTEINRTFLYGAIDVNTANSARTLTFKESIPYGHAIEVRVTGSNVNKLTVTVEGAFPQIDNASSFELAGLFSGATIVHESAGVWSFRKYAN